jgi:hypothetical protein
MRAVVLLVCRRVKECVIHVVYRRHAWAGPRSVIGRITIKTREDVCVLIAHRAMSSLEVPWNARKVVRVLSKLTEEQNRPQPHSFP